MSRALTSKVEGRGQLVTPLIVEELKSLAQTNKGLLKPEDVIEAARNEDSPLHNRFEWDDTAAAERYRLWQARILISVSVEMIKTRGKLRPTKVFVSLSTDRSEGIGYRTLVDVLSNRDQRKQLLMDSLAAMNAFQERYKQLQELGSVFEVMDETKGRIAKRIKGKS